MEPTLYRKYRPQIFAQLVDQNHIKTTLQNELERDKITHAYLFTGPRGIGKTTLARVFAKAVNCQKRKGSEPCDKCETCQQINAGKALDIIEIDAASNRGIDEIRDLREKVKYAPTNLKYKVYIIDEAHMLTLEAFNALLKTLEEPPAHVIFVLVTTEVRRLPQTIISRCQRFDFKKINNQDIVQRLNYLVSQEGKTVDKEILKSIARHSEGCIRDAESLLGQVLSLDDKKITAEQAELVMPRSDFNLVLELVGFLARNQTDKAIAMVNRLINEGVDLHVFTTDLIEFLRKMLLLKVSNQLNEFALVFDSDLEKEILSLVEKIDLKKLVVMLEIFIANKRELKSAEIIQLPLELAIIEICKTPTESQAEEKKDNSDFKDKDNSLSQSLNSKIKITSKAKKEEQKNKIKLTLGQVKGKWQEVLVCLKKYNQTLASTLKSYQPIDLKGDVVQLCFKYKFHQEIVNNEKNRKILEGALKEIFNIPLKIKAITIKDLPQEKKAEIEATLPQKTDPVVENILQTFGGEVVE